MPAGTGVSISWCVEPTRKRTRMGRERRPAYRRERHQQPHRVHALVVRRHNPRCFYLPVRIRRGRRTGTRVPPDTSAYEPSVQLVNRLTPGSVPSLPIPISPFYDMSTGVNPYQTSAIGSSLPETRADSFHPAKVLRKSHKFATGRGPAALFASRFAASRSALRAVVASGSVCSRPSAIHRKPAGHFQDPATAALHTRMK